MPRSLPLLGLLCALIAVACSSSSAAPDAATPGGTGCYITTLSPSGSSTCATCVYNSCPDQIDAIDATCTSYLACMCPTGSYQSSQATACGPQLSSSCNANLQAITSCAKLNCPNQCGV